MPNMRLEHAIKKVKETLIAPQISLEVLNAILKEARIPDELVKRFPDFPDRLLTQLGDYPAIRSEVFEDSMKIHPIAEKILYDLLDDIIMFSPELNELKNNVKNCFNNHNNEEDVFERAVSAINHFENPAILKKLLGNLEKRFRKNELLSNGEKVRELNLKLASLFSDLHDLLKQGSTLREVFAIIPKAFLRQYKPIALQITEDFLKEQELKTRKPK